MKSKFDLRSVLAAADIEAPETEHIEMISWGKLDVDERNFYSLDGIEELAANIETVGLLDPLRVRRSGERYTVVSGHRRRAAIELIIRDSAGVAFQDGIPCIVESTAASEAMQELRLILANASTRRMSDSDIAREIDRMTACFKQLQAEGYKFPGKMRSMIARICDVSETKVATLTAIKNNLIPEYKEKFDSGELATNSAYTISKAPPERQRELLETLPPELAAKSTEGQIREAVTAPKPEPSYDSQKYLEQLRKENDDITAAMDAGLGKVIMDHVGHDALTKRSRNECIMAIKSELHNGGHWGDKFGYDAFDGSKIRIICDGTTYSITYTDLYDYLTRWAIKKAKEPATPLWQDGGPEAPGCYLVRFRMPDGGILTPRLAWWNLGAWRFSLNGAAVSDVVEAEQWLELPEWEV